MRKTLAAMIILLPALLVPLWAGAQIDIICGDDICDYPYEDVYNCPQDCSGGGGCGDYYCDWYYGYEDPYNCPLDCGCVYPVQCLCPGVACVQMCFEVICGDGECVEFEDEYNCPQDCAGVYCPFCGDSYCESPYEDENNCPDDCYVPQDSDGDGLTDADEFYWGTDPSNPDTDGDGLTDGEEVNTYSSNPLLWDSDNDGLPDLYEATTAGMSATNPADAALDDDGDGNSNVDEYYNGTDMDVADNFGDAGCWFWGESGDGNGIIGPEDYAALQGKIAGLSDDYSGVIPPDWTVQDMNSDGVPDPGDLAVLQTMIAGLDTSMLGSRPVQIVVYDQPGAAVEMGETTHVSVHLLNDAGNYTSGFGVIFTIDPGSAGSATLLGGDGEAGGGRYDVTGPQPEALATIVLRIDAPGMVYLDVSVPACGSGETGKSSPELVLSPSVEIVGQ